MTTTIAPSISRSDQAIAILRSTNDGDDLAPADLKLIEMVVNNRASEAGLARFDEIADQVRRSAYQPPWLHGIEHLRKEHNSFVYWKGIEVEHFSFEDPQAEQRAAQQLAQACRDMEAAGVPVTSNNWVNFDRVMDFQRVAPEWLPLVASGYRANGRVYARGERGDEAALLVWIRNELGNPEGESSLCQLTKRAGEPDLQITFGPTPDFDSGVGLDLYYQLGMQGWSRPPSTEDAAKWVGWASRFGFTPENVTAAVDRAQQEWPEAIVRARHGERQR